MSMQQYQTTDWSLIRASKFDSSETGFARHLREICRPTQIAFHRLMARYDGNPVGIECKSPTRNAWAFVMPNLDGESAWKIQYFDEDGFSGHSCYASISIAAETMVREGFSEIDAGRLDTVSITKRWQLGVKKQAIRDRLNQGLITWTEMIAEMAPLNEFQSER